MAQVNIWGEVIKSNLLKDRFSEPPFTVLDAKSDRWQKRKRKWKALGIQSELGRDATAYSLQESFKKYGKENLPSDTSIFDPALCEVLYTWFAKEGCKILDPFAGGSVRGIIAQILGL